MSGVRTPLIRYISSKINQMKQPIIYLKKKEKSLLEASCAEVVL